MADLLATLSALPADVNRYTFMSQYLIGQYVVPNPHWVHALLWVFFFAYIIAFLLTLAGLIVKAMSGDFRLVQWKGGLLVPNGVVLYSIFEGIFIFLFAINFQWSIQDDTRKQAPTGRLALFGCLWSAFWIGGWCFTASSISYTLKVGPLAATTNKGGALAWQRRGAQFKRRFMIYTFDFVALVLPLAHIGSVASVFIPSNTHFTNAVNLMYGMSDTLVEKAPTYDPTTFNATVDLLPLLANMGPMMEETSQWVYYSGWGYSLLSGFCFFSLAVWVPFAIHLRSSLLKLMEPIGGGSGSGETNDSAFTQTVVSKRAAEQYGHLIWITGCIFLKDLAYGGVALCVAVKPDFVIDSKYNTVAVMLSASIFMFVGTYIAALIAWRAVQAFRYTRGQPAHHPLHSPGLRKPSVYAPAVLPLRPQCAASQTSFAFNEQGNGQGPQGLTVERDVHVHIAIGTSQDEKECYPLS